MTEHNETERMAEGWETIRREARTPLELTVANLRADETIDALSSLGGLAEKLIRMYQGSPLILAGACFAAGVAEGKRRERQRRRRD